MVYDPLASLGGRIQNLSLINIRKFEKCNVLLHVIMSRIFACLINMRISKSVSILKCTAKVIRYTEVAKGSVSIRAIRN